MGENAASIFVALVAWSLTRHLVNRWRSEIAQDYMWRRYYGRGSRVVVPMQAVGRALRHG